MNADAPTTTAHVSTAMVWCATEQHDRAALRKESNDFGVRLVLGVDGTRALRVSGEVDLSRCDELRRQLDALNEDAHSPGLVDLSGVTFLDSSGLAELVEAQKRAAERSTRVVLVAPSPPVVTILELTGLARFFEIRPDVRPSTDRRCVKTTPGR